MRPSAVIDVHTHVVPERWDDWSFRHTGPWPAIGHHDDGSASLVVGGKAIRAFSTGAFKAAARLEDMDRRGVGIHVISPPPPMFCYWAEAKPAQAWARMQNENIAALCATHPDRFVGMATLPMQDPLLAVEELRWVRERLGLRAIEIGTFPANRDFDDPALFPFFEACAALDVAVFVHPAMPVAAGDRLAGPLRSRLVGAIAPSRDGAAPAHGIRAPPLRRFAHSRRRHVAPRRRGDGAGYGDDGERLSPQHGYHRSRWRVSAAGLDAKVEAGVLGGNARRFLGF